MWNARNRCNIIRTGYAEDDAVGGAVETGTVVGENLRCDFAVDAPRTDFLQQGIEITKTARALVNTARRVIYEEDQFVLIYPPYHPYVNSTWRVKSVQVDGRPATKHSSMVRLSLQLIDYSRSDEKQA